MITLKQGDEVRVISKKGDYRIPESDKGILYINRIVSESIGRAFGLPIGSLILNDEQDTEVNGNFYDISDVSHVNGQEVSWRDEFEYKLKLNLQGVKDGI